MRILFAICLLLVLPSSKAQGVYTDFGQNRIQFDTKDWNYISYDNVEVYYTEKGQALAEKVLDLAQKHLPEVEKLLSFRAGNGIRFVAFNNLSQYRQNSIGLTSTQFYAGGNSYIIDNKAVVYFSGSHSDLAYQVKKGIAEVLINEMIYGGNIQEKLQANAILTLPRWYLNGAISYIARKWDVEMDNRMRDAIIGDKFKAFNSIEPEDVVLVGHSFWRYLDLKYGTTAVSNILYLTRVSRNIESALGYYTGLTMHILLQDWQSYYKEIYTKEETLFQPPKGAENASGRITKQRHTSFKISPNGKKLAFVTNEKGKYSLWLYDISSKTTKRLLTSGNKTNNQLVDYSFPIISWYPDNKNLAVIAEKKGSFKVLTVNIKTGSVNASGISSEIDWIKDITINSTGNIMAISAISGGQTDIFLMTLRSKSLTRLTNDVFDEASPSFTIGDSLLLFASNNSNDTFSSPYTNTFGIFVCNVSTGLVQRITPYDKRSNYTQPLDMGNGYITFLSDMNGIQNSCVAQLLPNINKEDIMPVTRYKRSIIYHDIAAEALLLAELIFIDDTYRVYITSVSENPMNDVIQGELEWTDFKKKMAGDTLQAKTTGKPVKKSQSNTDTTHAIVSPSDSLGYYLLNGFEKLDYDTGTIVPNKKLGNQLTGLTTNYVPEFGLDFFISQFDNSIIGSYLFPVGIDERAFYTPFFSGLIHMGITDLFKYHSFEAAMRFVGTLDGSDYAVKYTNRKGRIVKELKVFRRSRLIDDEINLTRMTSSSGSAELSYPFNERARVYLSFSVRQDKIVRLAIDSASMQYPDRDNIRLSSQIGYVYDNTLTKGLNLLEGSRFKIFAECFQEPKTSQYVFYAGIDARKYTKIHRQVILAQRATFNYSAGTQRIAFFMGGVENWIEPAFNNEVPYLASTEYAFQSIAAPMRGFLRNARSGSSYILVNNELRVPIVSYLYQKPIRSEFWKNIMIVPFLDLGCAWVGATPNSPDNPFNTIVIDKPSYTLTVNSNRNPWIVGTGFGIRTKILGYYVKFDRAWGYKENLWNNGINYLSVGLDF